jgi:SAM-dependent methyltransferase
MMQPVRKSWECRVCGTILRHSLVDLGLIPLCQAYATESQLDRGEMFYPLHADVCLNCSYVGLPAYLTAEEIFTEYAYFSSVSDSWVRYVRESVASLTREFHLGATSLVIEMASNDGYLLQFFVERGIPVVGVEPAANVAKVANAKGVPTLPRFFNLATAHELVDAGKVADLFLSYNSLDHVPDLSDVVTGMKLVLKPEGIIQIEIPYLRSMVEGNQFDTIYHDRFSYLSCRAVQRLFERHGLRLFDVIRIPTHGGSLRLRACHAASSHRESENVAKLLAEEEAAGMLSPAYYAAFTAQVASTKQSLLGLLLALKQAGSSIVGYGVAAKGNVLLNFCGVRGDFLDYLVDRSDYKIGKYAPGTRLPIKHVDAIRTTRPDYVLILPWNIKDEIIEQISFIREWGGKFIVAIPKVEIF